MFARETFIKIQPGKINEIRKIYAEQIVPVVKQQQGIVSAYLLEPTEKNDHELISLTLWHSKADAERYEKSGTYMQLVNKLKDTFAEPSTLKSFEIQQQTTIH
jgi:heme-degrading monooxygenase HmoA